MQQAVVQPGAFHLDVLGQHEGALELHAEGLLATCIQHELDHLDGVLFVDYLSALKRNMLLRKLAKEQKLKQREAM